MVWASQYDVLTYSLVNVVATCRILTDFWAHGILTTLGLLCTLEGSAPQGMEWA